MLLPLLLLPANGLAGFVVMVRRSFTRAEGARLEGLHGVT